MAFVYEHIANNKVFYIGMGKYKARPTSKSNRNRYWHNIVNKYGFEFRIVKDKISWEDAVELEVSLIKKLGRRDLGTGVLVNMTDGGEGRKKSIPWNLGKKHLSGENNPMFGVKRSDEWKKNHSKRCKKVNPKGVKHHKSKYVLDVATGIFYECVRDACDYGTKFSYPYLKEMLNGRKPNVTNLKYT